jgi:hypothetical protein
MYFAPASFCHQTILLRDSKNWFRNPNTVSGEILLRRTQLMMAAHRHHAWVRSRLFLAYHINPEFFRFPRRFWRENVVGIVSHGELHAMSPLLHTCRCGESYSARFPRLGNDPEIFCPVRSFSSTMSLIYQNML